MNQENGRRVWLGSFQPAEGGSTDSDVLVRRLNTSCNTVRSNAFVGVAVGSPTPNPIKLRLPLVFQMLKLRFYLVKPLLKQADWPMSCKMLAEH